MSKYDRDRLLARKKKFETDANATKLLVFCPCGENMHLAMPLLVYGSGTTSCSICMEMMDGLSFIYHCKEGMYIGPCHTIVANFWFV